MASQSPTKIPADQAAAAQAQDYFRAWQATTELLRLGHTWSGHEANVCLLNTHSPRFVDVSSLSGVDFLDDARGVAVVDWDHDGDLDLWVTNRTSPRVRYLQNQAFKENYSVTMRLVGVTCNRDAVGARVELHRGDDPSEVLIQTVRAGEGYLAQSSKTVHFGLGDGPRIDKTIVRWPGGEAETFTGLAAGESFELVQGEGVARRLEGGRPPLAAADPPDEAGVAAPTTQPTTSATAASTRATAPQVIGATHRGIRAARRLPLPTLEAQSLDGQRLRLDEPASESGARLIVLWAAWCQPCLVELGEFAQEGSRLRAAGVEVVPINVDGAKPDAPVAPGEAAQVLEQLGLSGPSGLATPELLDRLDIAQRVLTNKPFPPPIPSSFLLDATGRLIAVYKGPVGVEQLLQDVRSLETATADPRDAAVPFAGRWYTNPFPPDLLSIPKRLIEIGQPLAALEYLTSLEVRHPSDHSEYVGVLAHEMAGVYVHLARLFSAEGRLDEALAALQRAVAHHNENWDAHLGLAAIFASRGQQREAAAQYRTLLSLRPGDPFASRSLAWILATSKDPSVQKPDEAIRLATAACEASKYRSPADLDALAAAYASAGRFEEAAATARQAVAILTQAGQHPAAAAMQQRLRTYEQNQPLGSE